MRFHGFVHIELGVRRGTVQSGDYSLEHIGGAMTLEPPEDAEGWDSLI
jgi:hypothetical protein